MAMLTTTYLITDYDYCDMDAVIQIKECAGSAVCQTAPANLHCNCKERVNDTLAEHSHLLPKCKEIDQHFINSNLCPPGYYFKRREFCIDWACGQQEYITIDWCTVSRKCFISPKNRHCTCRYLRQPTKTQPNAVSHSCTDIDECLKNPCGAQEVCTNTPGSYSCVNSTCIDQNQFKSKQCSFIHWDQEIQSSSYTFHTYCSVINSIVVLVNKQCRDQKGEPIFQEIISTANDLLRNDSLWADMENEDRFYLASILMQSVENTAIGASLDLPDQGRRIKSTENIDLEIRTFQGKNTSVPDRVRLQAKGNFVDIDRSTVISENAKGKGFAAVALVAFKKMDFILNGSVFNLSTADGKLKPFRLISNVVSAVKTNMNSHGLDLTANFTFKHTEEAEGDLELHCANWKRTAGKGHWSPKGCVKGDSNGTHTWCRCNQLSSLAVLVTPFEWQTEPLALTIITFIGIPVSLVCLAIAIGIFVFWKHLKSTVNSTHLQLCLSLFLAELLFIVGINRTEIQVMCGIIAGILHYFFLAAFVWMFLEGVQLYLMVRNIMKLRVPHSEKIGKYMYLFGYGVPAVIVAISAAVYRDGYGSPNHCWLQTRRRFIWSFLGPVCVIVGINTFLFLITLWSLKKAVSKRDIAVSKLQDTRMLAFKAIAQVFILGCSWIFGLFHFREETVVMAYLFTIVNSFQGTFIFIILCVLNPKVRAQCRKWFSMMCKAKKIVSPKNIDTITPKTTKMSLEH
ncbi:adhesion G protein-coupled receptor E3-like [Heterodontus francisci]|uniref:adhesion G protein-coupled receptor E3-like n=1 Tax=Heterodontus francisci TaxID=7792 RepID=UPI00355C8BCA